MQDAAPAGARLRAAARLTRRLCASVVLLGACAGATRAQEPAAPPDATAIVRQAVANRLASEAMWRPMRFVFHKKDTQRDFTQEIIETRQGYVALTVMGGGKPLGPKGRQAQIARLDNLAAHPELQEHRLKRENADRARIDMLLKLLPEAFLYRYEKTVPCAVKEMPEIAVPWAGKPSDTDERGEMASCYQMSFEPNPKFDPPNLEARVFQGMAGEIWIETRDVRLYRLDAHLERDVSFGWGIIGRLNQGGTVSLQQNEVAPHHWELTRLRMNLTGKALLVKTLNIRIDEEMSQYEPVAPNLDYREAIEVLKREQQAIH
jgi:hypothetical protein